jgi:hypothetical protein
MVLCPRVRRIASLRLQRRDAHPGHCGNWKCTRTAGCGKERMALLNGRTVLNNRVDRSNRKTDVPFEARRCLFGFFRSYFPEKHRETKFGYFVLKIYYQYIARMRVLYI